MAGRLNVLLTFCSMDILFLADNFPPERNAQASRVYERACYWVRWGHRVTVITCAPNFPEGKVYPGYKNKLYQVEYMDGIRVVRVKTFIAPNVGKVLRIIDFLSYMVAAFLAGLIQPRPTVVAATSPQFFAAVAGWALAAARRLPFVLEVSDLWPESIVAVGAMKRNLALRVIESLELFLYDRAARVVVLTPAFKENLVSRGVSGRKADVVLNGVDLSRFAPRPRDPELACAWGLSETDFVVGYIGTVGMAHGLHNVLEAAAGCPDRIRFLIIGPGADRDRLVAEAERRGLHNVQFIPPQPKQTIPTYWSLCDVALVHLRGAPLFTTVIPSKIFEAMGMGLPILMVSPEGEASRLVLREGAGIWVPPDDPVALRDAVLLLEHNLELRRQLAERSRLAAPRYSRERQAREMLSVLEATAGVRAFQPITASS